MKLKNRLMPAILFCGVVALSSCEKNEQESVSPEFNQEMLSQILADSAKVTSYTFSGKELSQVNYHNQESGELESFEKFERDGNGQIIKSSTYAASSHALLMEQTYTYDSNGLLTKSNTDYYQDGKVSYTTFATFEYDGQQKLQKRSLFEVSSGDNEQNKEAEATHKSYITYSVLPNDNYAEEKQYVVDEKGKASLFSTTTYSYDSNQNPMYGFAEPGSTSSPNNVLASSTLVHKSNRTFKYAYTYTYNERGYPQTQSVVTPAGKTETYSYLYSN